MAHMPVFVDSIAPGTCRSCGKAITWAESARTGSRIPFDPPLETTPQPALFTDTRVIAITDAVSHFVSCPQAAQHRKAR